MVMFDLGTSVGKVEQCIQVRLRGAVGGTRTCRAEVTERSRKVRMVVAESGFLNRIYGPVAVTDNDKVKV